MCINNDFCYYKSNSIIIFIFPVGERKDRCISSMRAAACDGEFDNGTAKACPSFSTLRQ